MKIMETINFIWNPYCVYLIRCDVGVVLTIREIVVMTSPLPSTEFIYFLNTYQLKASKQDG